ncbi:MAG: carboxypeptidase regulatory-like domain-containing protein [Bdellovibrionales bacterium]|nr:carboxypeptidase regulatory-like domain-containing protein [Bdellovibrionales bacterium]
MLLHAIEGSSEISVLDSAGFTRAASEVEGLGDVEFNLLDAAGNPASGAEVTLTNTTTGEVLHAVSIEGSAVFEGVSPGVWTVTSTASGVTFTNVTITTATAALAAGGAAIGGGTLLAGTAATGGVIAGGVALADDDDNPLSPSS